MATVLPQNPKFIDENGNPYSGGFLYTYVPGTTNPKNSFQSPSGDVLNENPITLDVRGSCLLYGDGDFRCVLKDSNLNLVFDQVLAATLATSTISSAMLPVVGAATLSLARDLMGITGAIQTAVNHVATMTGPTGPVGPPGVTGPTGPAGPAGGSNVTNGTTVNGDWVNIAGLIVIQYGVVNLTNDGPITFTFPIPFPTACKSVVATSFVGIGGGEGTCEASPLSTTTFSVKTFSRLGPAFGAVNWVAYGN